MIVCVCVCVCHNCGTLCYSFSFGNQTDQGDETEGLEREGLKMERYGKGQIGEGGCEETFLCLSQTKEKCRFTVPPAVTQLNYISSDILWRIFCQTEIFAGFSLQIINLAVRISATVMAGDIIFFSVAGPVGDHTGAQNSIL